MSDFEIGRESRLNNKTSTYISTIRIHFIEVILNAVENAMNAFVFLFIKLSVKKGELQLDLYQ